jgi:predicted ATP-dependent endonuclease of OLD family
VFLGEQKKGLISLSNSGSGLKTAILVLLNLLVVPEIEQKKRSAFTFAFEELENNLHPALLRRLFRFLEDYAVKEKATVFLTTHSSTALDVFGVSNNAQIIHVTHDGETARSAGISAHFDHLGVISELGAKPSDLLQANGIIWVEGPSDCVYINRWLDIYSGGMTRRSKF